MIRLCLKELRETLRDPRTILTLVLMPLLVYPLLSIAFQRFLLTSLQPVEQVECVIAMPTDDDVARLQHELAWADLALEQAASSDDDETGGIEPLGGRPPAPAPKISWKTGDGLEQLLAEAVIDLAVFIEPLGGGRVDGPVRIRLLHRSGSPTSEAALSYVEGRLKVRNEQYVRETLQRHGVPPVLPAEISVEAVKAADAAFSVTAVLPLILILMTVTGAVYPAIDLTAGERERGTLEMLMAAPVPRLQLLGAKYVAVVTVAMLTAVANLIAMTITLSATGLGEALFGEGGLSLVVMGQVFGLLLLFVAFFAAILLAVTSFARSFKEAQAYLIPLMLFSLAPGMIGLLPGLEFNGILAVTPLLNMVILARDLLQGDVNLLLTVVAVLATAIYAMGALALAARIFGADAILLSNHVSWRDVFRPTAIQRRDAAQVSGALMCLAVLFPSYFMLASLAGQLETAAMETKLGISAATTVALFAGVPVLFAVLQRVRLVDGFLLHRAAILGFVGAGVLGLSLWPWSYELILAADALGMRLAGEYVDRVEVMLQALRGVSPALVLASLAIAPAVCEEFFFRGFLFRAIQARSNAIVTILVTAALFGAFHVVTSVMGAERFLSSTFIGLFLGWVCWRTGSVLPGMFLHAIHNGLLLMLAYYRDELAAAGWGVQEQQHLPWTWLAFSAVMVIAGVFILSLPRRGSHEGEDASVA